MLSDADVDALVSLAHAQYAACGYTPSSAAQYTVLAALALRAPGPPAQWKLIALATGAKCLPAARLPRAGDALHDSHAEVLARRGAVAWLHAELQRAAAGGSAWLEPGPGPGGRWRVRAGAALHMYVSAVPCGDASTRLLAAAQDAAVAACMDAAPPLPPPPGAAARGRAGYALLGALRTKPARGDAPATLCMACSDKLAAWGVLGVQGALGARVLAPLRIKGVVLGGVGPALHALVREDCARAFCGRLEGVRGLPPGFVLAAPEIHFTERVFVHSRAGLETLYPAAAVTSSNDALCWVADAGVPHEVIINGTRRGVGAKLRAQDKFRPRLCKASLFKLHRETLAMLGLPPLPPSMTYFDAKRSVADYRCARDALKGPGAPFAGWIVSGRAWESFDAAGVVREGEIQGDAPPNV